MRTLVLLRGSAGCGKSTWLKENGLNQYALCADDIRLLFQSPELQIDGSFAISQKNDREVWDLLKSLLERRMVRGEFTIIDATHNRASQITENYKKLCEKYRYRCYVVDFSDVPLETVLERNKKRPLYKQVPEDAIYNMYARMQTQPVPNWCTTIKPEQFWKTFGEYQPIDLSSYKRIHFIGDIHGCFDPLKEYFKEGLKEDEYYIFLGDYIDRGIQNDLVLEFLITIKENKNVLLLTGNHERWLSHYANGEIDRIASKEFKENTMPQLEGIDKSSLRELCRKISQIAYFRYGDKYVFANHGGLPCLPNWFIPTDEYIKGAGKYEDTIAVENTWNKAHSKSFYQVHGHRNIEDNPIQNGNCFNLCDNIEYGKCLRILQLDKDGFHTTMIKNNTFFIAEAVLPKSIETTKPEEIVTELRSNKFVQEKKLTEHISSFNFTRQAFYDKIWNAQTQRARGLFVNVATNKIVARSYDKFFQINENEDNALTILKKSLQFPLDVYLKYNGYLGIVGYDEESDELYVCSKSTNQGDFAKYFKEILKEKTNLNALKEYLKEHNVSLVFEVIDSVNDPHIIDYNGLREIILLDVIYRTFDYKKYSLYETQFVASMFGLKSKSWVGTIDTPEGLQEFYEGTTKQGFTYLGEEIEGFVIEDKTGYMVKIKTESYKMWKMFRGVLQRLQKGHTIDTKMFYTAEQNYIWNFLKGFSRESLQDKSIIDIKRLYKKSEGKY